MDHPHPNQKIRLSVNKQNKTKQKKSCRLVDFAIVTDRRVKI